MPWSLHFGGLQRASTKGQYAEVPENGDYRAVGDCGTDPIALVQ